MIKNTISKPLALALVLMSSSIAFAAEIEIPVKVLLAPSVGFESKNNTQVVLYGSLPNGCYTLSHSKVQRDLNAKTVTVVQYAVQDDTGVCAEGEEMPSHMKVEIPFTSVVSVGSLPVGEYTFHYSKEDGTEGSRIVNIAQNVTPRGDTLPYAAVSSVNVSDVVRKNQNIEVTLQGVLTSSCEKLSGSVKVTRESDVFVILPTVSVKRGRGVLCAYVLTPFEQKVNLGKAESGIYLIHTRSKSGRAVNRVIQVIP